MRKLFALTLLLLGTPTPTAISNIWFFNNLFSNDATAYYTADGIVDPLDSTIYFINNTVVNNHTSYTQFNAQPEVGFNVGNAGVTIPTVQVNNNIFVTVTLESTYRFAQVRFSTVMSEQNLVQCKLWDGTTTFATAETSVPYVTTAAATYTVVHLNAVAVEASGGTIKISCENSVASGIIYYQTPTSTLADASGISAVRIQ